MALSLIWIITGVACTFAALVAAVGDDLGCKSTAWGLFGLGLALMSAGGRLVS